LAQTLNSFVQVRVKSPGNLKEFVDKLSRRAHPDS